MSNEKDIETSLSDVWRRLEGNICGAKRRARIRERGKKNPLSNVTLYAFKEAVGKVTSYQNMLFFFLHAGKL